MDMDTMPMGLEFAGAIERNPLKSIDQRFLYLLGGSMAVHLVLATLMAMQPARPSEDALPLPGYTRSPLMKNPFAKPVETAPAASTAPGAPASALPKSRVNSTPSVKPAPIDVSQTGLIAVIGKNGGDGAFENLLNGNTAGLNQALTGISVVKVGTLESAQRQGAERGAAEHIAAPGTDGVRAVTLTEALPAKVPTKTIVDVNLVPETGDLRGLGAFITARKRSLESCYSRELKQSPTLAGKLMLRLTLAGAGRPAGVEVDDESLGSERVASCIRTVVSAWNLPFNANTTVELPLMFAPGN